MIHANASSILQVDKDMQRNGKRMFTHADTAAEKLRHESQNLWRDTAKAAEREVKPMWEYRHANLTTTLGKSLGPTSAP